VRDGTGGHPERWGWQNFAPAKRLRLGFFYSEARATDSMRKPQSLPQLWARRRRRQRIVAAVVIAVLLVALVYGWLYVYGVL
jgi:hypothetical protein